MSEKSSLMIKQENLELSKENEALKETVTKLLIEVDRLRNLPVPNSNIKRINKTPEEKIIEDQILLYEGMSLRGALTLDEIRGLDILLKNKKMLNENRPVEPEYSEITEKTPEEELLRIAGNVETPKLRKRHKSKTGSKDPVE